jgi:type IV pilus assembly protein PilP
MGMRAEERGAVMIREWVKVLFLALALLVVTTGCGEEEQLSAPTTDDFVEERQALAVRQKSAPKAPKASKAVKPAAQSISEEDDTDYAATEQDYFYDPRGKRDPFRSFQLVDDNRPDVKEFGPLEDFELGQLELSAVIWDANNPRALILDPGGRAYIVREGSQIGKNSGQIIHIGDNLVLVKETYENLAGEKTTKDVELRIRLSQGG